MNGDQPEEMVATSRAICFRVSVMAWRDGLVLDSQDALRRHPTFAIAGFDS